MGGAGSLVGGAGSLVGGVGIQTDEVMSQWVGSQEGGVEFHTNITVKHWWKISANVGG